ncbi:MAG: hypothetical protein F6K39_48735, partial [Okeania sp. SIO3B3]|nr:hypothetical protein [Okeania sp. SIO3B3]
RRKEEEGRRKKAGGRRQKAGGRRQKAEGRRQEAEGRRQEAEGRRENFMGYSLRQATFLWGFESPITEKFWFKASPFKGIIKKNFPLNQSSSFKGEVIINN